MQRELIVKGRSLGGNSDLTLLAPIKPGLIESLEAVTHKTRIKRVLDALHVGRMGSFEYATARLLSDSVERVGVIHSVRVAVLEPEDKVLLAVTFDGSWESYLRVLWQKVGTLLDLIFCGTIDYVTAYDHSYEEWLGWARRVQVETGFFYGPAEITAQDVLFLRRAEMLRAERADTELNSVRAALLPAEERAAEAAHTRRADPAFASGPSLAPARPNRIVHEQIQNGLEALAGLYRLVDLHLPGTPDGVVLHRAAHELLQEFVQLAGRTVGRKELTPAFEGPDAQPNSAQRFARQLKWLFPGWPQTNASPPLLKRLPIDVRDAPPLPRADRDDVQGGILRGYDQITHGAMLLLRFESRAGASALLRRLAQELTRDTDDHLARPGRVFANLAVTLAGLRALGVSEDELELFPEEFRQGMAARAGSLGDIRHNHPRRWRTPRRWDTVQGRPTGEPIDLSTVHAVLQWRVGAPDPASSATWSIEQPGHPLRATLRLFVDANPEVTVLAVQDLRRYHASDDPTQPRLVREHFGFVDGIGQPVLGPAGPGTTPGEERNLIHAGELVLGHDNAADTLPPASARGTDEREEARRGWLRNGSFLVVRRYRQFVDRFDEAVARGAAALAQAPGGDALSPAEREALVAAKMMGRTRAGDPLVPTPAGRPNDFDYDADPAGQACPLLSHVRRANPRFAPAVLRAPGARLPRLMRRGMSYGPPRTAGEDTPAIERGLVFMAYNASLGEQFEVIQRWLAGGNSTGGFSGHGCPILGVPENGTVRHFRFEHDQAVVRVPLEDPRKAALFDDPAPFAQLDWGLYLFTPSLATVARLAALSGARAVVAPPPPWRLREGRRVLAQLREIERTQSDEAAREAWKAALEDAGAIDRLVSASVWAAIREDHGGLLRTPYGVLVASRELILRVLQDPEHRYSVCGQQDRMAKCYGRIYLGMDESPRYHELADPVNAAIEALPPEEVFAMARGATERKLAEIEAQAQRAARRGGKTRFRVGVDPRELLEEVLATVCEEWFGLSTAGGHFERGGTRWDWQEPEPPLYPGHFTALSRYMFQPNPGPKVEALGIAYGQSLRRAMFAFLDDPRAVDGVPRRRSDGRPAPLAEAIIRHPTQGGDREFVATTMIGVMMGLIPTLTGAVLGTLREWLADGTFWSLRQGHAGEATLATMSRALHRPLAEALQMRPMPALTWRTVRHDHRFGPPGPGALDLRQGEVLVLALVSGTQQSLADGRPDGRIMFGGVRKPQNPHPTHACPGYHSGMAVMVGALSALITYPASATGETLLLPGPTAFSLSLDGPAAPPATILPSWNPPPPRTPDRVGQRVLAWGDSWVDRTVADDFVLELQTRGYEVPGVERFCDWKNWGHLADLAAAAREMLAAVDEAATTGLALKIPLGSFFEHLRAQSVRTPAPRAVLLSGGGNDSIEKALAELVLPYRRGKAQRTPLLNPTLLASHMATLGAQLRTVIRAIRATPGGASLPVILHGYDYPVPAGRGYDTSTLGYQWLRQAFEDQGYGQGAMYDLARARRAMKELIDAFNAMLAGLAADSSLGRVRHVDLRGKLDEAYGEANFRAAWRDDMHPVREAYRLLTEPIDAAIQQG